MKLVLLLLAFSISGQIMAQPTISQQIQEQSAQIQSSLVTWRRFIHQNPELSNREVNTAAYIVEQLKKMGNFEIREQVAKTGVVAILKGEKKGPTIALRADMDALPVKERNQLPFRSVVMAEYEGNTVPVMHACGHDSHVSMLLGAAKILSGMQKNLPGTVVFIFQPAEEGPPGNEEGGAPLMIKEGVLDKPAVEAIFGIHINSQTPLGVFTYKSGSSMASSDWFSVKVKGRQTHGSQPWNGTDPIAISAMMISGLQQLVSRESELTKAPVVISVGKIQAGIRSNIIPEEAEFGGTIRTLDSDMQKKIHKRLRELIENYAQAHGAQAEVTIDTKTLVTYNNPELVKKMIPALEKAAGKSNVREKEWSTGAEDFSYFSDRVPGFFFDLGALPSGVLPSQAAPHHTPDFIIDDSKLFVGTSAFCHLVFDYAASKLTK